MAIAVSQHRSNIATASRMAPSRTAFSQSNKPSTARTSSKQSSSISSSASIQSPCESHDRDGAPPTSDIEEERLSPSSPVSKQFAVPSAEREKSMDISMQARHGSGPPSPVIQGLKDGGYFPGPHEWSESLNSSQAPPAQEGKPSRPIINISNEDSRPKVGEEIPHGEVVKGKNLRVIALDFDDVCAQFVPTICAEHNLRYGTNLTPEDFQSYYFFQCKGWGTPAEVARKMQGLDALLPRSAPVPGFAQALKALHSLGHPLHIVTARSKASEADILEWLKQQGITVGTGENDILAALWFTDQYGSARPLIPEKGETASAHEREETLNEMLKSAWRDKIGNGKGGKSKLRVLRAINAALFIDDHHGNLDPIVNADPPVTCLLFGSYAWNRARSGCSTPVELMSYEERYSAGLALPGGEIELGDGLHRAATWDDVIEWVRRWDEAHEAGESV